MTLLSLSEDGDVDNRGMCDVWAGGFGAFNSEIRATKGMMGCLMCLCFYGTDE